MMFRTVSRVTSTGMPPPFPEASGPADTPGEVLVSATTISGVERKKFRPKLYPTASRMMQEMATASSVRFFSSNSRSPLSGSVCP